MSHKHAAQWIRCRPEREAYAVNEVFSAKPSCLPGGGGGGGVGVGESEGTLAVKTLKNKTKRS